LNVLILARDRIHSGWDLLTHPLYGNIQPFQQPFRSVLVGRPAVQKQSDPDVMMILEKAIHLFSQTSQGLSSRRNVPAIISDYASLDVYLMRESMEKHGIWKEKPSGTSGCGDVPDSLLPFTVKERR